MNKPTPPTGKVNCHHFDRTPFLDQSDFRIALSQCSYIRLKSLPHAVAVVVGLQPTNCGSWKKPCMMGRASLLLRLAMAWRPIFCIGSANSYSKGDESLWPQMTVSPGTRRSVIWRMTMELEIRKNALDTSRAKKRALLAQSLKRDDSP